MDAVRIRLSFTELQVRLEWVGGDCLLSVSGGERPHIGCVALAVPRPSLSGSGVRSCTSSVINLTGHKDEEICRYLAEAACRARGNTVVCTGGVHMDGITGEQIAEVREALPALAERICLLLKNAESRR